MDVTVSTLEHRALVLFSLSISVLIGCNAREEKLRLATTTSTHASGLLDLLVPRFTEETGVRVEVIAVGTGKALALAERGDVDCVLVHARAREDAFVEAGHGVDRRDVMVNDFVILGPPDDPAAVRGLADAATALRQIQERKCLFISRGDDSGTHIREQSLWRASGELPELSDTYQSAGQGMGACLQIADEKSAYILTDRGTYLAFKQRTQLEVLVEGDPRLKNPYGVIRVNPERHPHVHSRAALRFVEFLVSERGQSLIRNFRIEGEPLFTPNARSG